MRTDTYIDGLAQGYNNSIANALELLQPCTKQSICDIKLNLHYFRYGLWPVRRHAIIWTDTAYY